MPQVNPHKSSKEQLSVQPFDPDLAVQINSRCILVNDEVLAIWMAISKNSKSGPLFESIQNLHTPPEDGARELTFDQISERFDQIGRVIDELIGNDNSYNGYAHPGILLFEWTTDSAFIQVFETLLSGSEFAGRAFDIEDLRCVFSSRCILLPKSCVKLNKSELATTLAHEELHLYIHLNQDPEVLELMKRAQEVWDAMKSFASTIELPKWEYGESEDPVAIVMQNSKTLLDMFNGLIDDSYGEDISAEEFFLQVLDAEETKGLRNLGENKVSFDVHDRCKMFYGAVLKNAEEKDKALAKEIKEIRDQLRDHREGVKLLALEDLACIEKLELGERSGCLTAFIKLCQLSFSPSRRKL